MTITERTSDEVLTSLGQDRVATVTLNRPRQMNPLSSNTRRMLVHSLRQLDADPNVGAVIVTGAGKESFGAGQDLAEAREFDADSAVGWIEEWAELYETILTTSKPTVAAINGYAVGAAFQLALMCDLRIAAENANFGMPEIRDAIPCITGTWSLYDLIGRGRTAELILTGRMVSAGEALAWGIVSDVVPLDELLKRAHKLAAQLAAQSALAIRLNKVWLRRQLQGQLQATVQYAKDAHQQAFGSGEPQRVMTKFLAKRKTRQSK